LPAGWFADESARVVAGEQLPDRETRKPAPSGAGFPFVWARLKTEAEAEGSTEPSGSTSVSADRPDRMVWNDAPR
jgi:hypothetical protein